MSDELLPAAFLELYGDPAANPHEFPIVELGDYLSFATSGSRGWAEFYAAEGTRFIRSLDVRMNSFADEDAVFVDPPQNAEADRTRVNSGTTIEERLASIGVTVLQEALTPEWIGLLRLAIAEARRFPDLGSIVMRMTRERGAETMVRLLGEAAESGEVETFPAFSPDRLAMTARYFIDLILLPQLLRALSGEQLKTLHAEIGSHVSQRVAFFLSACRNGGIK